MKGKVAKADPAEVLARIEDFHGHLGPYVLMGFRAGQLALRTLGAEGYFDLEAVVHCGSRAPLSCFADGVQLGSGCTTGKGNLKVDPDRVEAAATFQVRADGTDTRSSPRQRRLTVRVRPEAERRAARWLRESGDRAAARQVFELSDRDLFETNLVEGELRPGRRGGASPSGARPD